MAYAAYHTTLPHMKGLNKSRFRVSFFCVFFVSKGNLFDVYFRGKECFSSRKHTCIILTPFNSTFIQQNLGLQGYTLFFFFLLKNRLWVLVRIASAMRF